jgi:hypothetical protein
MGRIYRNAGTVLVCLDQDLDGGAEDVAGLVKENADLVSKYDSIAEMLILASDDTLSDDPRWKSMATLTGCTWFTRAWVLQEVGLAKDPRILYGEVEFNYRDFMRLALLVDRCAPNLEARASISVHTDWLDWSPDWQRTATYPNEKFLDLLNRAKWLGYREHRDHIYAFLGHPLAQLDDGSGPIVAPDYLKQSKIFFLELAVQLVQQYGLRVLSPVEHDDRTLNEDFPSWVPFRWNMEIGCARSASTDFYYDASASTEQHPLAVVGNDYLKVRGLMVDVVSGAYRFSASDLENPAKFKPPQPALARGGNSGQRLERCTGHRDDFRIPLGRAI